MTAKSWLQGDKVDIIVDDGRHDDGTVSCLFSYYIFHGTVEHHNWHHSLRGQKTLELVLAWSFLIQISGREPAALPTARPLHQFLRKFLGRHLVKSSRSRLVGA